MQGMRILDYACDNAMDQGGEDPLNVWAAVEVCPTPFSPTHTLLSYIIPRYLRRVRSPRPFWILAVCQNLIQIKTRVDVVDTPIS